MLVVKISMRNFRAYSVRFAALHLLLYTLVAHLFLILQGALGAETQAVLDALSPYQPIGIIVASGLLVRSILLALVLFPFYATITDTAVDQTYADRRVIHSRGLRVLFGALWGVGMLGAVEPMPGSIEGVIYTETPWMGHVAVLAAGAAEVFLFSWLFLQWETRANPAPSHVQIVRPHGTPRPVNVHRGLRGYLLRFILLHVLTYGVIGGLFFTLQGYAEAFATQERFALYRPLDDPLVAAALPLQIVRGALIAFLLYPFYSTFMSSRRGWLLLFGLLFGLTALCTPRFVPGLMADFAAGTPPADLLLGPLEITLQMLLFSVILFLWERRRMANGPTR